MLVTERMQALGDHAKSSRQPPVKERKHAKAADESAAPPDTTDKTILENGPTHDSAVVELVDDVTPQIVLHESGTGDATQAAVQEDDDTSAAKRAIIHEWENWSALHSDELDDPNVSEYFFRHLKMKRPHLSTLGSQETWSIVRG